MAIEITEFADVSISISPTGVGLGNFGILGFLTLSSDAALAGKEITVGERSRAYTSLASVLGDWPTTSEVYASATAFYGQTPTPRDFLVMMSYDTDQAGSLVGGGSDTAEELGAITSGTLNLSVDGADFSITGLDFSADTTYDDIASTIDTALVTAVAGATCTHNGYQFVIESDTTGVASAVSPATGTAANALGLEVHQAKAVAGIVAEAPLDSLAAVVANGTDFTGLDIHKDLRDVLIAEETASVNSTFEFATFAEGASKIFMQTTNDLTTLVNTTNHVSAECKSGTFRFTMNVFSKNINTYVGSSVFGRAASTNFEAIGTTITLNLKQAPGIQAEDLTPAEFAKLRENFCSAVVQIGKTANAFTDSRMASGSWLDTTHGLLWLENRCETDLFNLLYTTNTKIPYTQAGINLVVSVLEGSLEAAVRNGLAAPGFLPDGTYLPTGYIVESVALGDVASGDKSNRIYKGLSFKVAGAGALHEVVVAGQFSE